MILDNFPDHPDVLALDWVEITFPLVNTTSITHPIVQGVIRSLKAKYRSLPVKKQINAFGKRNLLPKLSILTALSMLMKAWSSIPDGTFMNCFKKSGIPEKSMEKASNDEGDPLAGLDVEEDVMESLKDDLEMIKEKFHENYGMMAEELVDLDFEISVTNTVICRLMRTSLQTFLDMLMLTIRKNPMMKSNQLIVFPHQSSRT